ncbi:MAG: lysine biosynthesis protein LysX, partial [Planctomycetota bacterium]
MAIGLLASRIRVEEKLLIEAYATRGVEVLRLDERALALRADRASSPRELADLWAVHDRGIALASGVHLVELLEARGMACVNRADVIRVCGDKLRT